MITVLAWLLMLSVPVALGVVVWALLAAWRLGDDPEPETWTLRGTLTIADDDTDQ